MQQMIARLRSYHNGVHGQFFLEVADKLEELAASPGPARSEGPSAAAGSATLPGLTEAEHAELRMLKTKTFQEAGFRGWKRFNELWAKVTDAILTEWGE